MSTINVDHISPVTPGAATDFTSTIPPTFNGGAVGFGMSQIVPVSGTTYTLSASDMGKVIRTTSASPVVITAPSGLTVWGVYGIRQAGSGTVSVSAGGGVTITTPTGLAASGPGASLALHVAATNLYDLSGDLA